VVPGTTLIVYDSFFGNFVPLVAPWFERSVWVHVSDVSARRVNPEALPPFDRLLVETVEREAYHRDLDVLLRPLVER
jgi:hypothetical protein